MTRLPYSKPAALLLTLIFLCVYRGQPAQGAEMVQLPPPEDLQARLAAFADRNSTANQDKLGRALLGKTYLAEWDRRDFNRPGRWTQLKEVRAHMEQKDFPGALELFKRYTLLKLRYVEDYGLPRGRFDAYSTGLVGVQWINPLVQPEQREEILKKAEDLEANNLTVGSEQLHIGEPGSINWKAAVALHKEGGGWPWDVDSFSPLLAAYMLTGQKDYLDRWAAYADDWAMNQVYGVGATAIADLPDQWSGGAEVTLTFLRYLGGIAAQASGPQDFPAATFARVWMRLLDDYVPPSILYLRSNPQNWTDASLTVLPDLGFFLDEYPLGRQLIRESRRRLELLLPTHNLPDGPDLDSTVGYGGLYIVGAGIFLDRVSTRRIRIPDWMLTRWEKEEWRDNFPLEQWVRDIREEMLKRDRFLIAHTMASGEWPIGGARSDRRNRAGETYDRTLSFLPEVFQDPDLNKILSIGIGHTGEGVPSFTSERFPYSGFTYIRAGWKPTDPYLFMFCSPLPQGGVLSWRNNNSIGLSGFGYDMLETGENGTYDQPHTPVRVDGEEQFFHMGIPTWGHRGAMLTATAFKEPAPWRWHDSPQFNVAEGVYAGNFGRTKNIGGVTHQRLVHFVRGAGLWIVTDRLRSAETHDYTLDWRFGIQPGHPTDFIAGQIKVEAGDAVRTVREGGANVSLYHFPSAPLTFTTAEERTPPGGYRLHDFLRVSAGWKTQGESVVVTAIYPRQTLGEDLANIKPLNSPGVEGFEASTPKGDHILYQAAVKAPARLTLGGLTASGESLLLTISPDGVRHGVALGCRSLSLNGKAVAAPAADFEFELTRSGVSMTPIYTPVQPVQISPADTDLFLGQQVVTLACATPGTRIHYTLNGASPTPDSPVYNAPFTITGDTTVRARAFRNGTTTVPVTMSGTLASLVNRASFFEGTLAKATETPAAAHGLNYDYYEGRWQELLTSLDRMTPVKSGHVEKLLDVSPRGSAPTFAFRYSGFLDVPADGVYTFYAPPESYQPSVMAGYDLRVFVDQTEWYPGTDRHALGAWSMALQKGKHVFQVIYADLRADGAQKMNKPGQAPLVWNGLAPNLQLSGPGLPEGPIPPTMLWRGE